MSAWKKSIKKRGLIFLSLPSPFVCVELFDFFLIFSFCLLWKLNISTNEIVVTCWHKHPFASFWENWDETIDCFVLFFGDLYLKRWTPIDCNITQFKPLFIFTQLQQPFGKKNIYKKTINSGQKEEIKR